jgi:hypothetical protein
MTVNGVGYHFGKFSRRAIELIGSEDGPAPRYRAPMYLSEEAIDEFIELYKKEFEVDLSREEARRRATNVLALYRAVLGENPGQKNNEDRNQV